MLKERHRLQFDDLTFANFKDLELSIASVIDHLPQVGR
jgi:hypothetical protein